MIPVGTNLSLKDTPVATASLLFANWAIFLFLQGVYHDTAFNLAYYFMAIPGEQYPWQLVTSMFLHADIFHILGNSLFLLVFGPGADLLVLDQLRQAHIVQRQSACGSSEQAWSNRMNSRMSGEKLAASISAGGMRARPLRCVHRRAL